MKSKSLISALAKFNESHTDSEESLFEVLNPEEAMMTRGGTDGTCTCNNGSSYTSCPSNGVCTCNNGSSYTSN